MGFLTEPPVVQQQVLQMTNNCNLNDDHVVNRSNFVSDDKLLPLPRQHSMEDGENDAEDGADVAFVAQLVRGLDIDWRGRLLVDDDGIRALLLDVPAGALPKGSKEIFVKILEYAEEVLACERVFVRFDRHCGPSDRAILARTFMYFGFVAVAPESCPSAIKADNSVVMMYEIE